MQTVATPEAADPHRSGSKGRRCQALLELDTRQRFTDTTMGTGHEGGQQPWLVGSTDVEYVGPLIGLFVTRGGHGRQDDELPCRIWRAKPLPKAEIGKWGRIIKTAAIDPQ